jgi:hypothetical protein
MSIWFWSALAIWFVWDFIKSYFFGMNNQKLLRRIAVLEAEKAIYLSLIEMRKLPR